MGRRSRLGRHILQLHDFSTTLPRAVRPRVQHSEAKTSRKQSKAAAYGIMACGSPESDNDVVCDLRQPSNRTLGHRTCAYAFGGGAYVTGLYMLNDTIYDNTAIGADAPSTSPTAGSAEGGGVWASQTAFVNSTIVDNVARLAQPQWNENTWTGLWRWCLERLRCYVGQHDRGG